MSYLRTLGRALLGRAESKASAVGPLLARVMLGQPVWPRRDFAKLASEGYQQNPVVARSIGLIADAVASIPWLAYQGTGDKRTELEEHPFLALVAGPNPEQDGASFLTALVSHYLITGNAYVERTEERRIERMELYALRPDRMKVIPGETGTPQAYEYAVNGGTRRFAVDPDKGLRPILHLKRFHPLDDWYGMSPLDPAAWGVDLYNGSNAWNKALLDNAGAPSGAFVYAGDPANGNRMSDESYQQLKQEIAENVAGARNAGRPMLLEGGLDWKVMGLNPEQMQFLEAKHAAAREIAFALGVPPMLLGIPGDNTYSNYQEGNRAFYRQSVLPLAQMLVRAFQAWMASALGKGVWLELDLDGLDALAADRAEVWDRYEKSTILTVNEKRDALGYEPVDGGDQVYVSAGVLPIGIDATVAGGAAPDENEPADDDGTSRN